MARWGVLMDKREIGRRIRAQNSGIVEERSCEKFGLKQVGGSRTKIDGIHLKDGKRWSIKNTQSRSTQVHLTTQKSFISHFKLKPLAQEFVNKFFGNQMFINMPRQRYKIDEIPVKAVEAFKVFLENHQNEFVDYVVGGKEGIDYVAYNDNILSIQEIREACAQAKWTYTNTAIHLKNKNGKTFFHIQMKGSGKGATYHGVLCHIHEHLFRTKDARCSTR
jgi:hypothetical protein